MIAKSIARHVLLVGPDYRNHRGGIGAVIGSYRDQYEVFNFVPSFRPYANNLMKSFYFLQQFLKIIWQLSTNKDIRIVHIHSSKDGSMYRKLCVAYVSKQLFRKKVINHIHTGNFELFFAESNKLSKWFIRFFLSISDATVAVSESWKIYFQREFQLKNVYKISNIVSVPSNLSAAREAAGREIRFLFLGLIIDDKGLFDVMNVLIRHKVIFSGKLKLLIAGNGEVARLTGLIKQHELQAIVEYVGWVNGPEKEELLRSCDVFLLPSYYEGLPISVLEAMSYGKPVIATQVGGLPELVESNTNGILIEPGDHQAILEALLFYINDPSNIKVHGDRAFQIVKSYYPQSIIPKLEAVYSGLLS